MTSYLKPAFQFSDINQTVLLGKNTVVIQADGNTYHGDGEIHLDLLPKAGVYIYSEFQGIPDHVKLSIGLAQNEIKSFTFGGRNIDGFLLGSGGNIIQHSCPLKAA